MKAKFFIMFALSFSLTLNGFAQTSKNNQRGPTCTSCTDPNNEIINNGDGTFSAAVTGSQAYYWEICQGKATINGSNENEDVTVIGDPGAQSRIKLVRFEDGICFESCEIFTSPAQSPCENCVGINVVGNSVGSDCISANGYLNTCLDPNIDFVEWSWGLIQNCEPPCILDNATDIPFDSENANLSTLTVEDHYTYPELWFYATIHYLDGSTCYDSTKVDLFCDNMNIDTGGGGPGLAPEIKLNPNPSIKGANVQFDGVDIQEISKISIFDLSGNIRKEVVPSSKNFSIENLNAGLYLVQFYLKSGVMVQKKLVIQE